MHEKTYISHVFVPRVFLSWAENIFDLNMYHTQLKASFVVPRVVDKSTIKFNLYCLAMVCPFHKILALDLPMHECLQVKGDNAIMENFLFLESKAVMKLVTALVERSQLSDCRLLGPKMWRLVGQLLSYGPEFCNCDTSVNTFKVIVGNWWLNIIRTCVTRTV